MAKSLEIFALRKTVIKANFYSVLLKATLFRAKKVSFSLGECSFMRIEYYYICIFYEHFLPVSLEFGGML